MFNRKKHGFIVMWIVVAIVWTFGIYQFAYQRSHQTSTPEQAIKNMIRTERWTNGYTILSDKAAVAGGYFIAVEESTTSGQQYDVFYATVRNGRWVADDLRADIPRKYSGTSSVSISQHAPDMVIGATKSGVQVSAVVGYRAMGATRNEVPFSLVQIGNLPIWIYRFPTNSNIENKLVAYDKDGNPLR